VNDTNINKKAIKYKYNNNNNGQCISTQLDSDTFFDLDLRDEKMTTKMSRQTFFDVKPVGFQISHFFVIPAKTQLLPLLFGFGEILSSSLCAF
jgi:hypothetical protein